MQAKKSLGQHFLTDETVILRMVEGARLTSDDAVIEIGPGTGVLTRLLATRARKVIAVEADRDLMPKLLHEFPLSSNVTIVEGDILSVNMEALLCDESSYCVVANIPYYITANILQYLLELARQPKSMTLMMQKEVAKRVTASVGDLSILGIAVQYYARTEYLFDAPSAAFDPAPKVESAVVRMVPYRSFERDLDKTFFRVVRAGFSARRKTLLNTLSASLHQTKAVTEAQLRRVGIEPSLRAQALSIADWERLARDADGGKETHFQESVVKNTIA
jgi:16S rRNA (adenine1518-N6/adenine1519-N6)-dimethyltransferase